MSCPAAPASVSEHWAQQPLAQRLRCIEQFRAGVVRDLEHLAGVMTQETGKPIRMSRNELDGLLPRIDFFLAEKAYYEIDYELSHRPDWLRVPLAGILRILGEQEKVA